MKKIAKAIARGFWKLSVILTDHRMFEGYIDGKLYRSERKYDRKLRSLRRWETEEEMANHEAHVVMSVSYPIPDCLR